VRLRDAAAGQRKVQQGTGFLAWTNVMTAEEIRKTYDLYLAALERLDKPPTVAMLTSITNGVLLQATVEIAAQLAEMNERATEPELEKLRKELREEIAKWRPKGEKSI
jgi:hypothetical protein